MAERGGVRGVRGVRGAGDPGTIWEAQVVMLHTVPETVAERRRIDGLRGAMGSKICFGLGGGKMEDLMLSLLDFVLSWEMDGG